MQNKSKHLLHEGHATLESMSQAIWFNQWTFGLFRPYITGSVLEIGCGIGNFTGKLTDYKNVYAIDIEKHYVTTVKKKYAKLGIHVGEGDIETNKYFFQQKTFDTQICLNVLEHIQNDSKALRNMYRLLSPGGHLVLLVPAHQILYGEIDRAIGHFRRYSLPNLTEKLRGFGFHIIESRNINMLGAAGWLIAGKIMREPTVDERKIRLFNLIARFTLPLENVIPPPFGTSILVIAEKPKHQTFSSLARNTYNHPMSTKKR